MPLIRVSGNLNIYGNQGNFETDPSTWGFSSSHGLLLRSADQQTKNLFSLRLIANSDFVFGSIFIAKAKAPAITIGKTYEMVAKVRTSNALPIAPNNCYFSFQNLFVPNMDSEVTKTVLEAKDAWVEVKAYFTGSGLNLGTSEFTLYLRQVDGGAISLTGLLYVDEFEIYEVIDSDVVPDPDPGVESDKTYWSRNHMPYSVGQAEGLAALVNYRIRNEVHVEKITGSNTFEKVFTSELEPDDTEACVFYLRPAFRGLLTAAAPTLNLAAITRLTDRIKYFKNFHGDLYEDLTDPAALVESLVYTVVMGGLSKRKFVELGDYFTDYLPTTKKFLTWAPTTKYVDRQQEDYLNFFIYNVDIATIRQVVKVYFDDATNQTVTGDAVAVGVNQLYLLPAGPTNLSVATINPAKNVVKYEVWLIDQDDAVISEVRTYMIVLVRHPLTRHLLFLNSLGTFEVMRFTGQKEEKADFDRTIVQRFLAHNYAVGDGEFENTDNNYRDIYSYSTGFFKDSNSAQWLEYIKELFNSRSVFDVTTGERVPLIITTTSLPGKKDQEYERFARFEAIEAYYNENFTPEEL